jgi:quercetin dioxygenase-like cupin family protein
MNDGRWQTARIHEIQRAGGRRTWIPIRKHFGIAAFGVNGWTVDAEGEEIISEHTEDTGHQELYFVSSGRATFTVDAEEIDAPMGTLVFVHPGTKRKAVAREAGTTILTVGATPGEGFEVSSWEATAEMWPLYEAGDYEGAAAVLRAALERQRDPGLYYNLACMEALLGRSDDALEHLRHVVEEPRFRETAMNDSDLDSLRDDPRFASLLETS